MVLKRSLRCVSKTLPILKPKRPSSNSLLNLWSQSKSLTTRLYHFPIRITMSLNKSLLNSMSPIGCELCMPQLILEKCQWKLSSNSSFLSISLISNSWAWRILIQMKESVITMSLETPHMHNIEIGRDFPLKALLIYTTRIKPSDIMKKPSCLQLKQNRYLT